LNFPLAPPAAIEPPGAVPCAPGAAVPPEPTAPPGLPAPEGVAPDAELEVDDINAPAAGFIAPGPEAPSGAVEVDDDGDGELFGAPAPGFTSTLFLGFSPEPLKVAADDDDDEDGVRDMSANPFLPEVATSLAPSFSPACCDSGRSQKAGSCHGEHAAA